MYVTITATIIKTLLLLLLLLLLLCESSEGAINYGFTKKVRDISLLAKKLFASQKGFYSTELLG
jgi:hypothetical protein